MLGLFLYLFFPGTLPLGADPGFSVSAEAGPLWVDDGGAAFSWRSGLSFKKGEQFYSDIVLGQIISDLPRAEGAVLGGLGKFGFDAPRFGLDLGFGFFQHGLLSSETEYFSGYNDGGQGFFIAAAAAAHSGEWSVAPSFLYGSATWAGGSLHWFFGGPGIPALAVYGLSLGYRRQHELAFRYLSMDTDILSNDTESLFASPLEAYIAYYRVSLEISGLRLGGSLGGLYAEAGIKGSLTASNQHFAYFPYNFYSIDGSFGGYAGFGALDLKRTFSFFQCRVMIGALHIFQGEGGADIHYKKKSLFGGEEIFDTMPADLGGIGAAFMLLDAGFPSLRLGRHKKERLSLGLKKLFALPWGYERALPDSPASPEAQEPATGKLLKTILLSGLSFYGSLHW
ncbi:MAG: hypothetical protein LBG57_11355 [Treponema sp.]|nr:hypothetical protein [Treponema sp.]